MTYIIKYQQKDNDLTQKPRQMFDCSEVMRRFETHSVYNLHFSLYTELFIRLLLFYRLEIRLVIEVYIIVTYFYSIISSYRHKSNDIWQVNVSQSISF